MTEEYTPTTEAIRNAWVYSEMFKHIAEIAASGFDRWLNQLKAEAWDEGWEANEAESDPWMHGKRTDGNPYRSEK